MVFLEFLFFNDWCPVFRGTVFFSVARLSTVGIDTLLFYCACLKTGITQWESRGNGTRLKLWNGKEWA